MARKKLEKKTRKEREIPAYKKEIVEKLAEDLQKSKTVMFASTKGLPSSQFHQIKKNLRGKASIGVFKKSLMIRALDKCKNNGFQKLKEHVNADIALFLSNDNAFELASLLTENQTPVKAKVGDIAPEDIEIEPGSTELMAGPAISELSSVGLKVAVENGKITIKKGAIVTKAGEKIKDNVANVLGKLNILPMKAGFEPIVAYDVSDDKIYAGIKIDKKATLSELRNAIGKAFGFAVNLGYICKETIGYFIAKAGLEEQALSRIIGLNSDTNTREESK